MVVVLRPPCAPHHLQHVRDGEVHIALLLAVVELRALDDDKVGGEVDPPGEGGGGDEDEDLALDEELLHESAVLLRQARVVDAHAKGERVPQRLVANARDRLREVLLRHVDKLAGTLVRRAEGDEVEGGEARLAAAGDEDERGLVWRVLHDGAVRGLVHGGHARAVVLARVARDVNLKRHGANGRLEVEEARLAHAQPVGEVLGIGQGGGEGHEPHVPRARLRSHVAHAAHDHLEHGPAVFPKQVHFVEDERHHVAHVASVLPAARDGVPLLGRGAEYVGGAQGVRIRGHVPRELNEAQAQRARQLAPPVRHALAHEGLEGRHVHRLTPGVGVEEAQDGELGGHGLARARGRAHEEVLVRAVGGVEDLRLHGVEVVEAEELLEVGVAQRRARQRAQVEQGRVGRTSSWKIERAQGQRDDRLAPEEGLADHAHEVLRRQGLKERDGEGERVQLARLGLDEDEPLLVVDVLVVKVLHPHIPRLCAPVHAVRPLEFGHERELHAQHRARDWLGHERGAHGRQAARGLAHRGAKARVGHERSGLRVAHVQELVPRGARGLKAREHLLRETAHLAQGTARGPEAPL
mmetsp:Transcript_21616/g.58162  ORF Transcript_21616/g.58162 Transcript_21616/m.58162 type:complete len:581 (-) Transcript_21616:369-2111(-)